MGGGKPWARTERNDRDRTRSKTGSEAPGLSDRRVEPWEADVQIAPKNPVPVFPLPSLVLFPRASMPLHIFELRYRTMVREALSGERMIALALLKPGWERDYHGSPDFFPIACLARFQEVEWLPNDCYDLKLLGLARVRLGRIVREYPYRSARAELLREEPYTEDDPLIEIEKGALAERLLRWTARSAAAEGPSPTLPPGVPNYETLVNCACMAVDATPQEKLKLLELDSIVERGHRVGELLERRMRVARPSVEPGGEHN